MPYLMKSFEKVTRFEVYDTEEYYVDIIEKYDSFEAWITGKNYGVSALMFGSAKQNYFHDCPYEVTKKEFIKTVESNLRYEIAAYYDEYYADYEGESPKLYALPADTCLDKKKIGVTGNEKLTFKEICKLAIDHGISSNALFPFFREV